MLDHGRCGGNHSLFEGGKLGVGHVAEPFGDRLGNQIAPADRKKIEAAGAETEAGSIQGHCSPCRAEPWLGIPQAQDARRAER
jgi:hypothetical protein